MLIRAFRARNFMKFHELAVEEIPAQGLLGIEGSNEGGKSTIGELVQFALFGKTISSIASSLDDLINWDRDECSVELDFDIDDGRGSVQSYRVYRQIDKYGTNYAKLTRLPGREEIATGLIRVEEAMSKLLRFGFDDFTRSFFLAEKEFPRSPQQMRQYLDRMVGVDVLLAARTEAGRQIEGFEERFEKLQHEIGRNDQQIEKYVPNIAKLPEAEKQRDEHAAEVKRLDEEQDKIKRGEEQLERMVRAREAYRDRLSNLGKQKLSKLTGTVDHLLEGYPSPVNSPLLKSSQKDIEKVRGRLGELKRVIQRTAEVERSVDGATNALRDRLEGKAKDAYPTRRQALADAQEGARRRGGRSRTFGVLLLVISAVAGLAAAGPQIGWFAAPEGIATQAWLIGGGVLSGILLVLSFAAFARGAGHNRRLHELEREQSGLRHDEQHDRAIFERLSGMKRGEVRFEEFGADVKESGHAEVDAAVADFSQQRAKLLEGKGLDEFGSGLADQENRIVQRLKTTAKQLAKDLEKVEESLKRETNRRDRAETEIREYEKQAGRKAGLEEQNAELRREADGIRGEMETRQLLVELLDETVESVRHRAGPSLGKTMRRLLPYLTGGRYKDLKVTPQFDLQVFTSEKSDFLAQHELSGGTFEGLSLGFRLAFTQAFIRAVVRVPQFLFLDEPFKAMDAERVNRTLRALLRLSPELRQIFVIIPGIKDQDRHIFDHVYRVAVGEHELQSRGRAAESPRREELLDLPERGAAPPLPETEAEHADPFRSGLDDDDDSDTLENRWSSFAESEIRPDRDEGGLIG